jgi:hypothetical protein
MANPVHKAAENILCVVCGAAITKRQSFAYQKGRACRHHPEVQTESQKRLEEEEKQRQAKMQALKNRTPIGQSRGGSDHIPQGPECWSCRQPGIKSQEHWLLMAVAAEKCGLRGKNLFDTNALREAYGKPQRVLVLMPVPAEHPLVAKHPEIEQMHSMVAGLLLLCQECARRNKLEDVWEKSLAPEIPAETFKAWMSIAPVLPISQAVKETAKLEVAIEDQKVVAVMNEKPAETKENP